MFTVGVTISLSQFSSLQTAPLAFQSWCVRLTVLYHCTILQSINRLESSTLSLPNLSTLPTTVNSKEIISQLCNKTTPIDPIAHLERGIYSAIDHPLSVLPH